MFYIMKTQNGLEVDDGFKVLIIDKGLNQYLNDLLIEEHVTLEGRLKAIRKKYSLRNNIPIYIHEQCCFYATKPLRDYDTVCINYHSVLSIRKTPCNHAEIIFKNLKILRIKVPHATLIRKHLQTQQFLENFS